MTLLPYTVVHCNAALYQQKFMVKATYKQSLYLCSLLLCCGRHAYFVADWNISQATEAGPVESPFMPCICRSVFGLHTAVATIMSSRAFP